MYRLFSIISSILLLLPTQITVPTSVYGWTVDDVSNVSNIVAAAKASPKKLTTRIVFDEGTNPSDYVSAVSSLHPVSNIMGELSDSSAMASLSVPQYTSRAQKFLTAFPNTVDIWEIGNEINGDWTGSYSSVSQKVTGAYNIVHSAGKQTALTLWYNPGCKGSSRELDPIAFSNQYISANMRNGIDYVWISYYETECNNYRPTTATLTTLFNQLHSLYPAAKLGFGEVGLPNKVKSGTLAKAQSILNYYYNLHISTPNYVGGYFWWYGYEDFLPVSQNKPLWTAFKTDIQNY